MRGAKTIFSVFQGKQIDPNMEIIYSFYDTIMGEYFCKSLVFSQKILCKTHVFSFYFLKYCDLQNMIIIYQDQWVRMGNLIFKFPHLNNILSMGVFYKYSNCAIEIDYQRDYRTLFNKLYVCASENFVKFTQKILV
eukprot:TRINITY_DN7551_c2_g3_i1.p6 TRINITY_DN7551_c2_g3~~TRINITY_DN7551_c2_g3_i1.p6  ORF type:complete len:136 (+),score=1.23 TRINITY_DN7551_c2_g3_i1:1179-1586(+)